MDTKDMNYGSLARVLQMAYDQAATGKGNERHGNGLPFEQQPMQTISALLGGYDGMAYQICKKVTEARGLPTKEQRVKELLGVINYAAGMIIYEDRAEQMAITSVVLNTDNLDEETLRKMDRQMEDSGLIGKGEATTRAISRMTLARLDDRAMPTRTPRQGDAKKTLPLGSRGTGYQLATAQWMPGVEGGNDWIEVQLKQTKESGSATLERSAVQAGQLAAILAQHNEETEVTVVLRDEIEKRYRSTITGEVLNFEGVTIKDADKQWDRITVVSTPPVTE